MVNPDTDVPVGYLKWAEHEICLSFLAIFVEKVEKFSVSGIDDTSLLGDVIENVGKANDRLKQIGGTLQIVNGLLAEDEIEGLDALRGILTAASTAPIPGVSDMLEMYEKMVAAAQDGLNAIKKNQALVNAKQFESSLGMIHKFTGADLGDPAFIGKGTSSVVLSKDWLRANSDYFAEKLP